MKKLIVIITFLAVLFGNALTAQIAINTDGSDPDPSAILDLQSTDKGFLPPRMTNAQRSSISSPDEGLLFYNTDTHNWQGYNGTIWINLDGSSCEPEAPGAITGNQAVDDTATNEVYSIAPVNNAVSYNWLVPTGSTIISGQGTTNITVNFGTTSGNVSVRAESGCGNSIYTDLAVLVGLDIGDFYEGGVIFWLDGNGGGLVCAVSNQSTNATWGCYGIEISGANGIAIGTGAQNTIDIEAGCTTSGTAADICSNLSLNGYTDWFLPSKDELMEMYIHRAEINTTAIANGGTAFGTAFYWSSTEVNNNTAWGDYFDDGGPTQAVKTYSQRVRAIRAF